LKRLWGLLWVLLILFLLLLLAYHSACIWKLFYPLEYIEEINTCSRRNGLNPSLVAAVIRVESNFNHDAVSSRGASGLMQLMPETAAWVAGQMQMDYSPDMLTDPAVNIELGCWYLSSLVREFGSLYVALAAYNAGRGRVRTWLEAGIWNGRLEDVEQIPYRETREFITRVMAAWETYEQLYPQVWLRTTYVYNGNGRGSR